MRKLKNVLYVTSPDAYIMCEGEALKIRTDGNIVKLPAHNLEGLIQFGYPGASPAAMALCSRLGITMSFMNPYGKFMARVEGSQTGNILLRRQQYRIYFNNNDSINLSTRFVSAKLLNSRQILKRAKRDYPDRMKERLDKAIYKLKKLALKAYECDNEEKLRGIEGDAARAYFGVLDHLIFVDKNNFFINNRNKRPPIDNVNCLLSFLYTLLTHDCRSACEAIGLDPAAGFLHKDRPGRPSLALDLMEEFRSVLVDRLVISLINRKQLNKNNFLKMPNGEIRLDDTGRQIILKVWQDRKNKIITHPFLGEKIETGLLPYVQALLLSRYIRGDMDNYPAYIWR